MSKSIKQFFSYISSLALAALLVNGMLYLYYWHPQKYFVDNYATEAIHDPDQPFVEAKEGFAILRTDHNGYFNPNDLDMDENYIICLGSSDTQAKSIPFQKQYTQLLENRLEDKGIEVDVYNAGMDGVGLDSIVRHFKAATEKFPDADAYIIEMSWFPTINELHSAIEKEDKYIAFDKKIYIESLSLKQRAINFISQFPLPRLLNNQIAGMKRKESILPFVSFINKGSNKDKEQNSILYDNNKTENYIDEYYTALQLTMSKIRREAGDTPVILFYNSEMELQKNGELVDITNQDNLQRLQKACRQYNISFFELGEEYLLEYEKENHMIRGFWNTSPGEGHMNQYAHQIIANKLFQYLEKDYE